MRAPIKASTAAKAPNTDLRRLNVVVLVITWPVSLLSAAPRETRTGGIHPLGFWSPNPLLQSFAVSATPPVPRPAAFWGPVSFGSRPSRQRGADVDDVVPGREQHQHDDDRKTD